MQLNIINSIATAIRVKICALFLWVPRAAKLRLYYEVSNLCQGGKVPHALECGVLKQNKVEKKLFLFEGGSGKFQIFVKALC